MPSVIFVLLKFNILISQALKVKHKRALSLRENPRVVGDDTNPQITSRDV